MASEHPQSIYNLKSAICNLTLEITEGDLTSQTTDAVVNAANDHFWMGAGVAGAIKRRGGEAIEREAMAQGPVDAGECVITSGGRLAARYVIHAAVMGQDLQTSAQLIERATRNSLTLADAHRLESIAFPAFGTGVGGFPLDECARIMITACRDHASRSLRLVRLVLFGQTPYRTFVETAGELLGTPAGDGPDSPLSG
jgi:O-acetyl-ADP-ribose deacetylase (regulator of RNase III)